MEMHVPQFYSIQHTISQYVDDSNNVIGAEKNTEAEQYLKYYYNLLQIFYKVNKLQMNQTKTTFMATRKKRRKFDWDPWKMVAW